MLCMKRLSQHSAQTEGLTGHCRQASVGLSDSHVHVLHQMLMTVASCCGGGVWSHPQGGAASHVLRQLTQLTGHLLVAIPLDRRPRLCQSVLDVSGRVAAKTASRLSVFRLQRK